MTEAAAPRIALTLDDVAREVECSPVGVLRAYAFGHLAGTRQTNGRLRFTAGNVTRFVEAGSPGIEVPDIRPADQQDGSGWFENPDSDFHAKSFEAAVLAELGKQLPAPDEIAALAEAQMATNLSGEATITPELRGILTKKTPAFLRKPSRFPKLADAYLATQLRTEAKRVLADSESWLGRPIASLYTGIRHRYMSELSFKDIVAEAGKRVLEASIFTERRRTLTVNFIPGQTVVSVKVVLPLSRITTAGELTGRIAQLAF